MNLYLLIKFVERVSAPDAAAIPNPINWKPKLLRGKFKSFYSVILLALPHDL